MSTHHAAVHWQRDAATFVDGQYSRRHALHFAESLVVPGSASAAVVPAAFCDPNGLDPEAAFVASVAGCRLPVAGCRLPHAVVSVARGKCRFCSRSL